MKIPFNTPLPCVSMAVRMVRGRSIEIRPILLLFACSNFDATCIRREIEEIEKKGGREREGERRGGRGEGRGEGGREEGNGRKGKERKEKKEQGRKEKKKEKKNNKIPSKYPQQHLYLQ
jgi:hypothetical protein